MEPIGKPKPLLNRLKSSKSVECTTYVKPEDQENVTRTIENEDQLKPKFSVADFAQTTRS
jgi:hypothetical protein